MAVTSAQIVDEVQKFVGDSYVYGATGPSSFDCSGLVQYVLKQVGITAPRTSEAQWGWVQKISASDLQPGDLVFAEFPGDGPSPGHVGVYTGNGRVLSAQDPALGVGYATLDSWQGNIVGYGRVPSASYKGGPGILGDVENALGGLTQLVVPSQVTGFFTDAEQAASKLLWIINPENTARVIAAVFGFVLLGAGLIALIKAA